VKEGVVDLAPLVRVLETVAAKGGPPTLFHVVEGAGDEFQLGVLPIEHVSPFEMLLGFDAPAEWSALGLLSGGWAHTPAGRQRVTMAVAVDRAGGLSAHTRLADGQELTEPPSEGRVLDCLRRAMGLPTPPPPDGSGAWAEVRTAVADGSVTAPNTPPWLAQWMDDGMFARWVSSEEVGIAAR
jgi:hypothetical protein